MFVLDDFHPPLEFWPEEDGPKDDGPKDEHGRIRKPARDSA